MNGHLQGILWWDTLEGRQVTDILVIEPFDFEVKIHVFCTFAQAVLVMLCNAENTRHTLVSTQHILAPKNTPELVFSQDHMTKATES